MTYDHEPTLETTAVQSQMFEDCADLYAEGTYMHAVLNAASEVEMQLHRLDPNEATRAWLAQVWARHVEPLVNPFGGNDEETVRSPNSLPCDDPDPDHIHDDGNCCECSGLHCCGWSNCPVQVDMSGGGPLGMDQRQWEEKYRANSPSVTGIRQFD